MRRSTKLIILLSGTAAPALGAVPPLPCCETVTRTYAFPTTGAIPNPGAVVFPVTVTGAPTWLWDIDVTLFITHTSCADLDITLTSPAGTIVTLTTDNAGTFDNVFWGTVWDDQAGVINPPGAATDAVYTNNFIQPALAPEEALGAFRGQNPNGTWNITITDDDGFDSGMFRGGSIMVTACAGPPPETMLTRSNETQQPILDGQETASTIFVVGAGSTITRVRVTTRMTHSACGNLDVALISPAGTEVTLTSMNGAAAANIFADTLWRDDAGAVTPPGPVTDTAFVNGVNAPLLAPEEALAAFAGEDPNGSWTLRVRDTVGGNEGVLNSWALEVLSCGTPPCPADITGDGVVNSSDLARILVQWGGCP